MRMRTGLPVIPDLIRNRMTFENLWIPAFAGMTKTVSA